MQLDALLQPRSIALIGASERPSLGRAIQVSLDKLGFEGAVYPINPKYDEILGRRCYPSISDVPEAPDAVAFCVGYNRVLDNLKLAAERGVRATAIFDGGFAERGEDGQRLQADIAAVCREAGIALCGPNCMGVLSPHSRSSLYMQELRDPTGLAGNVGLVSQSGSICIGMLADLRRFGFSHVVSSGNEATLASVDYVEALIDDLNTRVIALFLESVRAPDRFVAALDRAADAGKPVVVLKVGRNERTQRAITSHTGGLAGSSRVFSEVLRAHRAIEVDDFDAFTEVIAACQSERWPTGRRLAVITASGGQAELILDVATDAGVSLPPLPAASRAEAERVISPITGDGNPFDAWGNGDYTTNFPHAFKVLDTNPDCDVVAMCADAFDDPPMGREERALDYATLLVDAAKASAKPHYVMGMRPGVMMRRQINFLREHGIAIVGGARQGLGALDKLARWAADPPATRAERALAGRGVHGALAGGEPRRAINEFDSKALLAAEGLPVTRERLVRKLPEAQAAAKEIGYPVVLKAVSDDIAHKSDHGLVVVGVKNGAELQAAWARIGEAAKAAAEHGKILGFLVQEMVSGGVEVFAGVNRDPDFGLVFAFGLGGVTIEILQDVALRVLPLRAGDAEAMTAEIKGAPILKGARGMCPLDVPALVACLEVFADYAWTDRDTIAEIDLNPIKVLSTGQGCRIVDALIVPKS